MGTYFTTGTRGRKHLVPDVASDTFALIGATQTWTNKTFTSPIISGEPAPTDHLGAKTGATVAAVEYGTGVIHQTVLTLTGTPITLSDTVAPAQGGGVLIYTFPEGRILVHGSTGALAFTTTSTLASTLNASSSCRWALGSILYNNTSGIGTLISTEVSFLPSVTCVSSATINVANTATNGALAASAQFDGTTTPVPVYLNFSVPTASDIDGNATITAAGTITLSWAWLGDY